MAEKEDRGRDREEAEEEVLPVEAYRDELMTQVAQHQIIICQGETGSGKTTKIPQFFLDSPLLSGGLRIAVTQPRRIAAITVAQRVAEERHVRLGDEVGYCVRFDDNTSTNTRAKFMTDGILVRECLSDPKLSRYQAVMLDEAHERSIHTDILFGLVKKACQSRPDLKVVVTSATLNEEKFSVFFQNCPIINIPGRLFHVDLYHSKVRQVMTASGPSNNSYVDSCVNTVLKIHGSEEKGHILVFLTGSDEIERACSSLRHQLDDRRAEFGGGNEDDLVVVPLYASLSPQEQRKAFISYGHRRKCVIATNIAETSVTVPGIRFVVDPGYVKQKCYDPSRRIESLLVVPISKVSAQQRAGRAGRTGPGQCYRLYSSDCYNQFEIETIPEIMRCNLTNTLLYLKVLGIQDVMGFEFMDPPSPQQLSEGLVMLHLLGALDDKGYVTSPVGQGMAIYPLDPALSRMLVEAARPENDCLDELAIIAAMLSVEEIFHFPKRRGGGGGKSSRHQQEDEDERNAVTFAHDRLRHLKGDHFTYLKIFKKFESEAGGYEWCERNFIRYRAMKTATKIRTQLMADASKVAALYAVKSSEKSGRHQDSARRSTRDIEGAIQRSLAAGLFMNSGRKCANGMAYHSVPMKLNVGGEAMNSSDEVDESVIHLRDMLEEVKLLHLHPTAAFGGTSGNNPPDCLVYQDLMFTGRIMMRHVTMIDEYIVKRYREKWSFVHPLLLSGRKLAKKKRKIAPEAVDTNANSSPENKKMATGAPVTGSSTATKMDDAKARYLKRKMEKAGK